MNPLYVERGVEFGAALLALAALWLAWSAFSEAKSSRRRLDGLLRERLTAAAPRVADADVRLLRADLATMDTALRQLRAEVSQSVARSVAEPEEPPPVLEEAPSPAVTDPWADARPVEFDGEELRLSRSLQAIGAVVISNDGSTAKVILNPQAQLDHVAFERWSALFDFHGGASYARYQVVQPAVVRWDAASGRGRPISKGTAEAVR